MKPNDFFQFHEASQPEIVQECAILIHKAKNLSEGNHYAGNQFLASMHDFVANDRGESVIGAGRLLTKEDVESILRSMLEMKGKKVNLLPSNVVCLAETHIAWTVPAMVRPILFNIVGMPMRRLSVPWPKLLMVANLNGKLAVSALKTKGRVVAGTKLYRAPLMNVYQGGNVCTGSATLPDDCGLEQTKQWESVMFDSAFSHVNNPFTLYLNGKEREVDTNKHYRFWHSLAKNKVESFPNENLTPLELSVEDFIESNA